MEMHAIVSFIVFALINAFTPGPGNILALNTMTNYGWRKGKKLFLGIFAGYYCVQALCAFFVFGLDQFIHPIMDVLKYVGTIYIIWLAIQVAISKPNEQAEDKEPSFWIGFILQFVNVKIYMFGITALTGYIVPYYTSLGMLMLFEMIIATMGSIATTTWIFFGAVFQKAYSKHFRVVNVILAITLLECAFQLAFQ
ncbi:LysE family transporter [Pelosinus fermentans]|uniref:Lysine exporter protein (LYSE/YGGA) n=1 Tax=Pelosinus fermentans JBW45 TaxID=1192197 RepID=I8TMS0_9FIRM|nr:LysE family transporter [Pelosinus fermentans]AJQ25651.1 Lysine exporter protein (LYSE/YGGA) [Pelosinus fermentans JBW45]